MADVTIDDLPQAGTIDAIADWLPIWTDNISETQKINRNTLLGITGNPIGTTDLQTLSNKTLGNTNTVSLKDTLFTLQDDSDTTKQAKFQLSGITSATTRTYTLPNASSTLADIATAQTFTNKTLTSPTITGGTIDNSTITVDSIAGHSTSTIVTVGGVQMNNGTIGTSNAVITASIADSAVTPAKLVAGTGSSWVWSSFTPTWANLTIGNGTQTGKWSQIGKLVVVYTYTTFGTTTTMGTNPILTLPTTASSSYAVGDAIGFAQSVDTGTASYIGQAVISSTTTVAAEAWDSSGATVKATTITASVPFSWGTGSVLQMQFYYRVD